MNEQQNGTSNKMKQYQIIIIIVAALIILGVAAYFIITSAQKEEIPAMQTIDAVDSGDEVTDAVSATEFQIGLEDVVANVDGQPVTGQDVLTSYEHVVNFYGEPDAESLELYYSVAMEEAITLALIQATAADMGLDQFTQEETDELYVSADAEWQYALDNYVSYNLTETDAATEEEKTAAYAEAAAYYGMMGYTKDTLRQSYLDNEVFERVKTELCKDVTVTEDEVLAYYNEAVQSDKEVYEFDIDAYENQLMMYQYGYADQEPWYHPEGYRYSKHILLPVDETLMQTYTDLQARYEEQMSAEDTDTNTAEDADVLETAVTAEDVDAAKADIIASLQDTIDEINQKIAEGVSFDDLMVEYGTDPGMTGGTFPLGYEVSLASYSYVPEFISAAFSVDAIGQISEPTLSDYGVHIVQYAGDVPGGPKELTDDLKTVINQNLLDEKCNVILADWHANADIQYTGIIRSVDEIQAEEAAETQE